MVIYFPIQESLVLHKKNHLFQYPQTGLLQEKFTDPGIDPGGEEISCVVIWGQREQPVQRLGRQEPVRHTEEASRVGAL